MKLNKIFFLSIFILFVLLLGAVSAEENVTLDDREVAQDINVTFPEKVYVEDSVDIEVNLPERASGSLKATVDDVEIYNENITEKSVKIPVTIPKSKFPYLVVNRITDHTPHKIGIFYNDLALNMTHNLKLMKFKPEHDYVCGIPQEILKGDNSYYQHAVLNFPASARGTVEIYVDGILVERLNTSTFTPLNMSNLNGLVIGNHTVRVVYSGDDYYSGSDKTYAFTVVDMLIDIPSNIVLEHDDCLTAKTINNTDGTLRVFIDSKFVFAGKLDNQGEFLKSLFDYVTCGQHMIEVRYDAGNFTKSKRVSVNVSYYVDCWQDNFVYGEDNLISIIVPTDFNKDLITIGIDGVKCDGFTIDNSGLIDLDISGFDAGNHTLSFYFLGDEKYNSCNLTHDFTIRYDIHCPYFLDDNYSQILIILPNNAKGSLEVFIDDEPFESQILKMGKASISLNGLKGGFHNITARYAGHDFGVDQIDSIIYVPFKPTIKASDKTVYYSDGVKFKVKILRGSEAESYGYVAIKIGKKTYGAYTDENGIATFNLPKLTPGKYTLKITCDGVKTTKTLTVKQVLSLKTVKIKKSSKKVVLSATLKKGKKAIKGKWVTFKFNGKIYKVKTNSKGVAKVTIKKSVIKKLKVGKKYAYKVTYLKTSIKKTVKVKK